MATIPTFNMRLVCCLRYEICKSETLLFIIFFFFFPFFFHFFGASVVPQLSNPNPLIPFFQPPVQLIGAFFFLLDLRTGRSALTDSIRRRRFCWIFLFAFSVFSISFPFSHPPLIVVKEIASISIQNRHEVHRGLRSNVIDSKVLLQLVDRLG